MLKGLIILPFIIVGCSNLGFSAWNESSVSCPDSEIDNGGSVELVPGYCKSGKGFFLSYEYKIK